MEQLLTTKLFIPTTRPELVPRSRLIEQLNNGLHRKLTLISSPAGFGKTTLVTEWLDNLCLDAKKETQTENKVAWLSLDEGDNDPVRFLSYFIAALKRVEGMNTSFGEGALSMLQSPQPTPVEIILTSLINELISAPYRIVTVLDDYHLIETPPIHDAMGFLLENLPSQMHLVIATREDPHLPLSRLRARNQMTEIRATDLCFTTSEATAFLNQTMCLDLSVEDVASLKNRTEGWITGLQLAAISLQGQGDTTSFIQEFTGSHRLVLDYLVEEVLNRQPGNVQTFLLQTAVLNRFTGSLCDMLTGQEDGQATLEALERTNLFVIPLDDERRWYRYHHLFADLLRQRLHLKQPDLVLELHHRASEWYEQNRFADEAIEHALRADNFERAAHMLEEQIDALWGRGEHGMLKRWLAKFPDELLFSRPHLCIFHAWYHFASGDQDAAKHSLKAVELALDSSTYITTETSQLNREAYLSDSDRMKLRGKAAAIQAFMDSYRGDVPGMILNSRRALEYLPEQDFPMRIFAAISLGDAYTHKGEMTAAYQSRIDAIEISKSTDLPYFQIAASLKLIATLKSLGQLHRAVDVCQQYYKLAETSGLSHVELVGLLLAEWGEVLAEFNDLDGAIERAQKGVELTEQGADLSVLGRSYRIMMRVLFSRGDAAGAEKVIQKMETIARETATPFKYMNHIAAWQTRFWLAQNELEAASQWARQERLDIDRELNPLHELGFLSLVEFTSLVRVRIAQEQWDEAFRLLSQLLEAVEAGEHTSGIIEIHLLQALAFQASGDLEQAVGSLERALTLAEPFGFLRIFVDEGPPMAKLLYDALSKGIMPDYVQKLLAAFPVDEPDQLPRNQPRSHESEWIEPLSDRELEVLRLVAEGLSRQEIAAKLVLSLNTVKTHVRNIYSKLGANNQMKAVGKARALGLLENE